MTAKRKQKAVRKKAPARKKARKSAAKKKRLDQLLDRELEDTFPASDPIELTEPGRRTRRRRLG